MKKIFLASLLALISTTAWAQDPVKDTVRMKFTGSQTKFSFITEDAICYVDWGDGAVERYYHPFGGQILRHNYANTNTYSIKFWVDKRGFEYEEGELYTETIADLNFTMDMVRVEGGTFTMGATSEQGNSYDSDERPTHSVTLSSYHIGKYEITQAQWKAVMGTTIEQQRDKAGYSSLYGVGDNYPMYYVSWTEAKEFCDKLSEKTGKKYALPTEAQWEFAARGGVKSKGYKYSGSNTIGDVAWYYGNSSSTHAVGTKAANELGIYDMSGNVWEWCADWYGSYSSDAVTNPTGPSTGSYRVYRGGSWRYDGSNCRVSNRGNEYPGNYDRYLGFRVVCLP